MENNDFGSSDRDTKPRELRQSLVRKLHALNRSERVTGIISSQPARIKQKRLRLSDHQRLASYMIIVELINAIHRPCLSPQV